MIDEEDVRSKDKLKLEVHVIAFMGQGCSALLRGARVASNQRLPELD